MADVTRADVCAVACADLFAGDGEILVSPMGTIPTIGARLARLTSAPDILLSDGDNTAQLDPQALASVAAQAGVRIFPIGIGSGANMTKLAELSPNRPPLRLRGLNFKEFFEWLSRSVSRVSQSTPGENVALDTAGIAAWGQV